MADIAIPKLIVWAEQLPVLGTGKVDLVAVKGLAEQANSAVPAAE
jgi:hypothetical protein